MGSIFPLVPPLKINVKNKGEWNSFRILMDWPKLQVWTNEELIQDLDVESHPDLRHRLRRGYVGFESLSYANRFRNLRIRELPSKQTWQTLYESAADFLKIKAFHLDLYGFHCGPPHKRLVSCARTGIRSTQF